MHAKSHNNNSNIIKYGENDVRGNPVGA